MQHFTDDIDNPFLKETVWGDAADSDGNGLPYVMEFVFRTDPNMPDFNEVSAIPAGLARNILVEDGGGIYPAIQYSKRIIALDLTMIVGVSTDLALWYYSEADIV